MAVFLTVQTDDMHVGFDGAKINFDRITAF